MSKYFNLKKNALLLAVLMLITSIIGPFSNETVKAAIVKDVITSMNVTGKDGKPLTGPVNEWTSFRVNANFELPNNTVKKGDTSTIKLPKQIQFFDGEKFEIKDGKGNVVANAVIDTNTKTVKLTYTEYVESHADITGNFFFYVDIDTKVVTKEEKITLTFDVDGKIIPGGNVEYKPDGLAKTDIVKAGVQNKEDPQILEYYVAVNRKATIYPNVIITDTLQDNAMEFVKDSFVIQRGTWKVIDGDWKLNPIENVTGKYPVNFSGRSFSINLGNINGEGYIIRYKVRVKYKPVDGEVFKNTIQMKSNDKVVNTATFPLRIQIAGGTAEGYIYSVNVHKKDENGKSLAGAEFTLIRDRSGIEIGKIVTDINGKGSFSGLLKDDYTLKETKAPPGYVLSGEEIKITPADFESSVAVLKEISNVLATEVKVTKKWNDKNDHDKIRPDSVEVELVEDGVPTGKKATLNVGNNWTYTWTNLIKNKGGTPIKYTVRENKVPVGYEVDIKQESEGSFVFIATNSHTPEEIDINGSKTWNDADNQDGKRPASIVINLLADGVQVDTKTVTDAEGWAWSFTGLPKKANGTDIVYTIEEIVVPEYTSNVNGYDIENNYTPEEIDINGSKTWNDADNQDGKRPASIVINLLADGVQVDTKTVTDAEGWAWSFTGLPKKANGTDIVYTIEEIVVPEYTSNVNGYDIENNYTPEEIDINGSKTWNDANNQDGKRPASIVINLLADGVQVDTKTVTDAEGWAWSFTGLPKKANGTDIVYTIEEIVVPEYTSNVNGYDIENNYTPEETEVKVTKEWKDNDNQDGKRPASIKVKLLPTGEEVELSEANNWTYTWTGLDKFKDGEEIVYTVKESAVPEGYDVEITKVDDGTFTFTITNSYTPETVDVEGSKTWNDDNNSAGKRPTEIKINLLADGVQVDTRTVTEADNWKWSFIGLPKFKAGELIEYTITEEIVAYYGTEVNGFDVTNTYIPPTEIVVEKNLKGRDLTPYEFFFEIKGMGILEETYNEKDGKSSFSKAEFSKLEFKEVGTYSYEISEINTGDRTVNYDETVYKLEIIVKMEDGKLVKITTVNGEPADSDIVELKFTNTTGDTDIDGDKDKEKISISGSITWDDDNNRNNQRPDKVKVILYADGIEVSSLEITEAENWRYSFKQLPKTNEAKSKIDYTISESVIPNYEAEIKKFDITNRHISQGAEQEEIVSEKIDLRGTITWEDGNTRGNNPSEVAVKLYANGLLVNTRTVTEAEGWSWEFRDLEKNINGVEVKYTIEVSEVSGYTYTVDGLNIKYTLIEDNSEDLGEGLELEDKDLSVLDLPKEELLEEVIDIVTPEDNGAGDN